MNLASRQCLFLLLATSLTTTVALADTNTFSSITLVSEYGSVTPTNLTQLMALSPDELEKVDIGLIDLLCAEGLSGSEDLDVQKSLDTLDAWARHVESETKRNQHLYEEHPERFKFSLPYYRMAMLATVLSQDLRIQYSPEP